eukprot:TRINITY_DN357_c0_g1_i2.p1 TRINITY_DN357_c0_g1~~TRINITY_DN357_c0_g1_i2.p1  ORF type:complete len:334 (-),score=60.50 TRINITY_DN357_c0_g1_i2:50-1006(-)
MSHLSENDVATWLSNTVQLPEYVAIFKSNNVDGHVLAELNDDDLKSMGIASLGHRKKILTMAKSFASHSGATHHQPHHQSHHQPHHQPHHQQHNQPHHQPHHQQHHQPHTQQHGKSEGTPFVRMQLEGSGLQSGKEGEKQSFNIKCLDPKVNKAKDIDKNKLAVNITGPSTVKPTVSGSGSSYTVSYTAQHSGQYFVDVLYEGKSVLPELIKLVITSHADARKCVAEVPPSARANQKTSIKIFAKDANGNPVVGGGEPFKINVNGPDNKSLSELSIDNQGNDVYILSCILHVSGASYTFHISLHGTPIGNSPLTIKCV